MPSPPPHRPIDATLSVTKAAKLLGVHPNTVRAWSDAGRLRYYRINPRGDRRYRLGDLQRFLAVAERSDVREDGPPTGHGARRGQPRRDRGAPASSPHGTDVLPNAEAEASGGQAAIVDRRARDLDVFVTLADLTATAGSGVGHDLGTTLSSAAATIAAAYGCTTSVWQLREDRLVPRATAGQYSGRLVDLPAAFGVLGRALASEAPALAGAQDAGPGPIIPGADGEIAAPIPGLGGAWGVLHVAAPSGVAAQHGGHAGSGLPDPTLTARLASALGAVVRAARRGEEVAHRVHRAEALQRVAGDIGNRLDLDHILAGLVDHALILFEADRGAVFLRHPDGRVAAEVARGLSPNYLAALRSTGLPSLPRAAADAGRPLYAMHYRDDPRAASIRAAVIQEGFDTVCVAPLLDGDVDLGHLSVYHDRPHDWTSDELETIAALATQASVAIRTAQHYAQMATWTAQLQSIQQLGARLNRLTSVEEIGLAIANELRQLIDYHNVRVYRLYGEDLIPVAMQGQVGEYVDETPEQLRSKLGEGITGWVALHKVAQNLPDAANDPRASTIPGTEDDLDESMLLAPMLFEDQVLGVLVLSKLGLHRFTDDDLRLLVIYASFAAQAMANADATARLREQSEALQRQVRSQRELLGISESILSTLDPSAVLEQIADRLATLVGYDNIAIEIVDRSTGTLRPLTTRGVHADLETEPREAGEPGLATWVVEHNEPVLVVDERADPRIRQTGREPVEGSMILVPLRGRDGARGVLTLERLGTGNVYTQSEFEVVQLFAAQVSVALENAEIHRAVEIRARSDDLTGLLNHGTFHERLAAGVAHGEQFSLVMIDLDDFKRVNDAFGHQAGDRLLRQIAETIVRAARESDAVFRYGGDEFTILLPGADGSAAAVVAERVRTALGELGRPGAAWHIDGTNVSASFGLATFPTDGETAASVLLAADRACFVAKRRGRGEIATADEGLALAGEFSLQEPTPVDRPTPIGPSDGPLESDPAA